MGSLSADSALQRQNGAPVDHCAPRAGATVSPTGRTNRTGGDERGGVMTAPDTIVLIHGFWVTPRSWEGWKARYEAQGYTVHTPAYPGFEVEVEALRADPTPIANLTGKAVVDHLDAFLRSLDTPTKPILMGHSAGGTF